MPEQKHTKQDLEIMQAWPLERKIRVTQTRLMEWKMKYKSALNTTKQKHSLQLHFKGRFPDDHK